MIRTIGIQNLVLRPRNCKWADHELSVPQLQQPLSIKVTEMQPNQPQHEHPEILNVTVLVDGEPLSKTYPAAEHVHAVIVNLLPPAERNKADQYILTDSTQQPPKELDPGKSLKANGVQSGHLLSLTKRDGGGGVK